MVWKQPQQQYPEHSPHFKYDDDHQDNGSTRATKGDARSEHEQDDVDASILRLEEAASSSFHNYESCDEEEQREFEDLGNGYDSYFMSEDEDVEHKHEDEDERPMLCLQKISTSVGPPCRGVGVVGRDAWPEERTNVRSSKSMTSSPLSGLSTASSSPARSRKRGDRDEREEEEEEEEEHIHQQGHAAVLSTAPSCRDGGSASSRNKQRRHSYGEGGGLLYATKRVTGVNMTNGPGIFDSPNKKTSSSFIFLENNAYDDQCEDDNASDDVDVDRHCGGGGLGGENGSGNESDCSLVQSFPRLLSCTKSRSKQGHTASSTLPPLPSTPFGKQNKHLSPDRSTRAAPHTIAHPSRSNHKGRDRDRNQEGGMGSLERKGSLGSHDWRRKRLGLGLPSSASVSPNTLFQLPPRRVGGLFGGPDDESEEESGQSPASSFSSMHSQSVFGADGLEEGHHSDHHHLEMFDDYIVSPAGSTEKKGSRGLADTVQDMAMPSLSRYELFPQPDFTDDSSNYSPQRGSKNASAIAGTGAGAGAGSEVKVQVELELDRSGSSTGSGSLRPMPDQGAFGDSSAKTTDLKRSGFSTSVETSFSVPPGDSSSDIISQSSPTLGHSARKAKRDRDRDKAAPVCPPTPERTVLWLHIDDNHPDYYDQSEANNLLVDQQQRHQDEEVDDFNLSRPMFSSSSQDENFGGGRSNLSMPLPMRRQNSLVDTKILASSTLSRAPRSFAEEDKQVQHLLEEVRQNAMAGTEAGADSPLGQEEEEEEEFTDILFDRDFVNKGIIGSGTFAEVFKCTLRNGSHESFAIKKSRRQFRSKRDRADLLSEVHIMQIVGATECPYLIQFYRAWQENCYFYVQIELAERGTLRDLMTSHSHGQQAVQGKTVLRILHDVASGLEHIHQCGVVHLDIKPQNILISLDGTVKIGDFGIAMAQGTDGDEGHEGDTR